MKKLFALILISAGLLPFTACITSMQPLVTYDKITSDQRIVGNWIDKDDKERENLVFKVEPLSNSEIIKGMSMSIVNDQKVFSFTGDPYKDSILMKNAYVVTYEENSVSYTLIAALMRMGKHTFMDVYPVYMIDSTASKDRPSPYDFNYDYLPAFTIAKVNFTANGLILNFVDGEKIKQLAQEGKIKLKYESDDLFDMFLVTASSKELQLFIEKYGDDDRIFNEKTTVTLTRQQPAHL